MLPASWWVPVDLYCERLDASFWAEPVNAISNLAFLAAAVAAFAAWSRLVRRDIAVFLLIVAVVAVGFGSFAFHTLATRGAIWLDVVPIGFFIYGYFLLALRRFLLLGWLPALILLAGFIALSLLLADAVPREILNGSSGYFPALAALFVVGWLTRTRAWGKALLWAGVAFAFSLLFRIIDLDICGRFPLGTHFVWHCLNALVLFLALFAAISERSHGPP